MENIKQEKIKTPRELQFAELVPQVWDALAEVSRTGWVRRGVKNPESVRAHTISSRNIVIEISDLLTEFSEKDKDDILDMLEVHDWPEAKLGDEVITNKDLEERKRLKAEKFRREIEVMKSICKNLGHKGLEILDLWIRFEEKKDSLAIFARQVETYQSIEKANEYEKAGETVSTQEFIDYYGIDIFHPILVARIKKIKSGLK